MWILVEKKNEAPNHNQSVANEAGGVLTATRPVQVFHPPRRIWKNFFKSPTQCAQAHCSPPFYGYRTKTEAGGFEPPIPFRVCRISSAVISTTHPRLPLSHILGRASNRRSYCFSHSEHLSIFCDFYKKCYSFLAFLFLIFEAEVGNKCRKVNGKTGTDP